VTEDVLHSVIDMKWLNGFVVELESSGGGDDDDGGLVKCSCEGKGRVEWQGAIIIMQKDFVVLFIGQFERAKIVRK
jgi:hypothetical protein